MVSHPNSFPENFFSGMSQEAHDDVMGDPQGPPSLYVDGPRPLTERSSVQGSIVDDGTPKGANMKKALSAEAARLRAEDAS